MKGISKCIGVLIFATASFAPDAYAQWNFDTQNIIYSNNGNVGIGTTTPSFKLSVAGTIASDLAYMSSWPDAGNGYTRSYFGSNAYWNPTVSRWEVRAIGNNDFASIIHPNADGLAFFTAPSTGNVARSLTHSEFWGYERMRISATGYVGIGTRYPSSLLHLNSESNVVDLKFSSSYNGATLRYTGTSANNSDQRLAFTMGGGTELFTLLNDGKISTYGSPHVGSFNVGVPTNSYSMTLGSSAGVGFSNTILGKYGLYMGVSGTGTTWIQGGRSDGQAVAYDISLQASGGNVGIGTNYPDAKLAVSGLVHAQEVKVSVNVPGPDYVFEEEYKLLPLPEIETYIKANKHLPEVPAAKEMEANGINLSEMNMLLLKKVEELTLHLIEMKKQIDSQEKRIKELTK